MRVLFSVFLARFLGLQTRFCLAPIPGVAPYLVLLAVQQIRRRSDAEVDTSNLFLI
jgi:hypothetical protein